MDTIKLTQGTINALNVLKEEKELLTLHDLKDIDESIATAHLTALARAGLVEVAEVEIPVTTVKTYKAWKITELGESAIVEVKK